MQILNQVIINDFRPSIYNSGGTVDALNLIDKIKMLKI